MIAAFISMPTWLSTVLSVLVAILVLLVMITVHELGHFLAGKLLKFKINEFAIGFGKPIYRRVGKSGQAFSIRMVPLGGYCAFEGEDEEKEVEGAFNKQAPWKRLVVLFSGAFCNFIFSVLLVIFSFSVFGQFLTSVSKVYDVNDANSAYVFEEGDVILSINGRDIYLTDDISSATKNLHEGALVPVTVIRGGVEKDIEIVYRQYQFQDKTHTGFGVTLTSINHRFGFFESLGRSFVYIFKLLVSTLLIPAKLITGIVGIDQLGGPFTTIGMTAQFVQMGFHYLLEISAMIGISLAVFNLFPIPALDGARMVFTTIEWVRKKPINRKVEGYIHAIGLILLFSLVLVVDLLHFL